jgi:flagellar basal-body rod protein FlgB
MSIPSLFDTTIARLGYGLDGLSERQSIIADNVANVDTPGYLTHDIPFESSLLSAMSNDTFASQAGLGGEAGAVPGALPSSITRTDLRTRNDGNNVDTNQQMTEMARTSVTYEAATQLITGKFVLLSSAIAPIS